MEHTELLGLAPEEKKAWFKEATITHRLLEQTDRVVMRAIREHGGFAYVLVYGPSGAGKTTMIHQLSQRLNEAFLRLVPGTQSLLRAPASHRFLCWCSKPVRQMERPSTARTTTATLSSSWENPSMSIAGSLTFTVNTPGKGERKGEATRPTSMIPRNCTTGWSRRIGGMGCGP